MVAAAYRVVGLTAEVEKSGGVFARFAVADERFFGWARLGADIPDAPTGDIDALIAAANLVSRWAD